ncbi:MAG: sugar phosphate isomerase/epimerase [Pleurocapsa minor GSE-CHR-MK-17-07R]|jgi:sugar phosphate isomerase/epimerase|nr:sugar phosphate isomerase/epimerase [Pleurocapsa minor GSE-CHR-MK 17-07R]
MMRLGLGSYALAWSIGVPGFSAPSQAWTAFDVLNFAHELGLCVVQLADNLPLHTLGAETLRELRDKAAALNIAVEVGTRGIAPDHLRLYLDYAKTFASPIVRVVLDTADHHPSVPEAAGLIREVMPDYERAGVTLAIENHDRFKSRELVELLARIDHAHVGICLDTVNSFGALEGPEVVVAALGPYVVNLHVKEFVVRRAAHNMGFTVFGAPAGQGMLDMPWLLGELAQHGRDFNAIIEAWPAPEATTDETAAKEQRWARESTAYLRGLIKDDAQ